MEYFLQPALAVGCVARQFGVPVPEGEGIVLLNPVQLIGLFNPVVVRRECMGQAAFPEVRAQHIKQSVYRFCIEKIKDVPEQANVEQGLRGNLKQVLEPGLQIWSRVLLVNKRELRKNIDEVQFATEIREKSDRLR